MAKPVNMEETQKLSRYTKYSQLWYQMGELVRFLTLSRSPIIALWESCPLLSLIFFRQEARTLKDIFDVGQW
jgi:hypothetical protein